ncbi:DgyrCDS8316 [Dimorphilus gyrociliatus]|uniref:DgyrCDS8316 n=1 Tax=Dimorphilus gyrociliatus TaxID=2664684 RepID=A0A7I8VYX8_9ANNE|nr:DgyrCDS8316 [Dimorphilus gyrociliatus]
MAAVDKLAESGQEPLKINGNMEENGVNGEDKFKIEWGFDLEDAYKLALMFYREKEGKAMQLSYKDKIRLVALIKQVAYGKYRADVSPAVGFLDVVGNDRRQAWQSLGDMKKEDAMREFIDLLNRVCQLFKPFMQAQLAEKEDKEKQLREEEVARKEVEEAAERERKLLEEEARRQQELERVKLSQQEQHIRAVLNQQTYPQFSQYAAQQHPNDSQQQAALLTQLQEQHYQQYMQQVYRQQLHQQQQYKQLNPSTTSLEDVNVKDKTESDNEEDEEEGKRIIAEEDEKVDPQLVDKLPPIVPAALWTKKEGKRFKEERREKTSVISAPSMWTRKELKEFKESLKADKDTILKVGSGETVTIRVPTSEHGNCLFWEFATDYFDIAFGVSFEWTINPEENIRVEINESSDEEEEIEEGAKPPGDVEGGKKKPDGPPQDEIIPVYRRDCHEEVYCGSHMYPGKGVYLLKFDNSYSLWRSKTVYYRVYYTN